MNYARTCSECGARMPSDPGIENLCPRCLLVLGLGGDEAERKQIATRYRSEGERESLKIRAEADRKRMEILAQAKRQALETEGDAEAEAARIYNEAYGKNPAFYEFLRTLESYETSLNEGTTILLPSNMRYLRTFLEATKAASGSNR